MTAAELGAAGSLLALALPLTLAIALLVPALRPAVLRLAPWATVPAVILAGSLATSDVRWDLVMFGLRFGVDDPMTRAFLLLTSCVWLASGVFARAYLAGDPRRVRFWVYFLATSSANLGVVLARDVASFYLWYALMTFASYGLIVHAATPEARRAGRVYLVMALAGEMLLLTAFLLIVGANLNLALEEVPRVVAGSGRRDLIVGLVLVGFGIKAGALGLHMWLPLAHPVAPTPASAILSGALVKAGLLGWLRFLPLGIVALPAAGVVCVGAGLGAVFYAVAIGLTQRDPKTILAYSSISQMGFMTATLGVALASPELAELAVAVIVLYAVHHALAKGALFLGTGVASAAGSPWPRRLVLLGLLVPALDLAGAPLSSGALAKLSLKDVLAGSPWGGLPFGIMLSLGAVGTTLLLAHFFVEVSSRRPTSARPTVGLWAPWLVLIVVDVALLVRPPGEADPAALVSAGHVWSALWPVLVGIAGYGVARLLRRRGVTLRPRVPPGDVLVVFTAAADLSLRWHVTLGRELGGAAARLRATIARLPVRRIAEGALRSAASVEESLRGFGTIGLLFLAFATLAVLLAWIA